jgi:hypothetical protein
VVPALPAAAAESLVLASGTGSVGGADAGTEMSTDGGTTWSPAVIMPPSPGTYAVLPGTQWVSSDTGHGWSQQHRTTHFRTSFTLPDGAEPTGVTICVHSDNVTTVSVNGAVVGAQPHAETFANFQGAAECFEYSGSFVDGANVLGFAVHNFTGPMGLDYRAVVTYEERANTPPVLSVPDDVTVDATSPDGAAVEFSATATDDSAVAGVSCSPASGSTFGAGTTTVTCTATDDDGATATGSFTVTVRGAADQLGDLLLAADGVGPGRSLPAKVRSAIGALAAGDVATTCATLHAFGNEVRAQTGKSIPPAVAAALTADATRIRSVLGCG